jgi:hypothetical protein
MTASKSQLRKQKRRLFRHELWEKQNRKCAICFRDVQITEFHDGEKVPPNSAHLLHLESRLDHDRGRFGPGTERHIVACPKCCFDYGNALQNVLTPEEMWMRSGRAPEDNPFEGYGIPEPLIE